MNKKIYITITISAVLITCLTCNIPIAFAEDEPLTDNGIHIMESEDSGEQTEEIIQVESMAEPSVAEPDAVSDLFSSLKKLGVTIVSGVIKAVRFIAREVVTSVLRIVVKRGEDNIIGSDTFPAQTVEYRVENSLVEEDSRIFVSFTSDTGNKTWHISEKVPGRGFTIRLSEITPKPLTFDYWIVLVDGEGNFDMGIDVTQDELTEEEFIKKFQHGELELLSQKTNFRFDEELKFRFKYKRKLKKNITTLAASVVNLFRDEYSNIIIEAKAIDPYETMSFDMMPQVKNWGNGEFSIDLLRLAHSFREFQPGKYKLKIRIEDNGKIFIGEQDFYWGVLVINTNKSIYLLGEETYIQMAVLDDTGDTICDAYLNLEITDPKGKKIVLTTLNKTIQHSGECGPNNVTNMPDYVAFYEVNGLGIYQMNLTAATIDGTNSVTDSFEVRDQVSFDVERIGPTRIYPLANYNMRIRIKANQDFKGDIFELVPASFEIINKGLKIKDTQTGEYVPYGPKPWLQENENSAKRILWENIELKQGDEIEIQYVFDAPDISPYLYLLGPLQIETFKEIRQWQIASDSPNQKIEQQINIVTKESGSAMSSQPTDNSLGLIYWDADKYNGETVYFEAVIRTLNAGNTASASLHTNTGAYVDGTTVTTTNDTYTRVRTGSPITLTDDTQYTVRIGTDTDAAYIIVARLIILQSATSITDTVTQIEVGRYTYGQDAVYMPRSYIYYYYDNDVWDPTPTVYFEATLSGVDTLGSTTIEGPHHPDTGTSNASEPSGADHAWTDPGNIASDDAAYAYTDAMSDNEYTYYLEATGFSGFDAIPDDATIKGIEVEIVHKEGTLNDDEIQDHALYLIKGGSIGGDDNASTGLDWDNTGADETFYYGDTHADLWGLSWQPSDIKDETGFGVALSVEMQKDGAGNTETAHVNNIRITVGWAVDTIVTSSAALYTTGGTYVTEVELASATWDEYQLVRTSNSFSLSDNTEYEVRMKTSGAQAWISNGKIILEQSGTINELEITHKYVAALSVITDFQATYATTSSQNKWDPANWDEWSFSAYYEAILYQNFTDDGANYSQLRDIDTPADIANSEVSQTADETYERKRSSEIYNDLPSSAKQIDTQHKCIVSVGSANCYIYGSWLIIQLTAVAVDEKDSFFLVF